MARWAAALRGVLPSARRNGADAVVSNARREDDVLLESARARAPVVWLVGKVQSGKTSIIRAITRSSDAEIGEGFRACTRASRIYEFPGEAPVLRFLDTRGLGEAGYDANEDLAFSESSAHLVLATMRAMDPQQDAVVRVLRQVRQRHPDWPVVVAQTTLHDAYGPGQGHILPYPFSPNAPASAIDKIPVDLMRSLAYQRAPLDGLPGRVAPVFVPIDLTSAGDGLEPADYGLDELTEALASVAPSGLLAALSAMPGFSADPKARAADPLVMGHAMAAAGGDLVPIPVAGALAVTTIQARLLSQLGRLYGIDWDRRAYAELSAAIGAGALVRMASGVGLRQLAKFIPVYGQTAGAAASAAASFAVTYALGKAAIYYLHRRRLGSSDARGVAETYRAALREAFRMARERRTAASQAETRP